MAGDGEAARMRPRSPVYKGRRALHYIVQRTVVLDKVEVCSSDWTKGHAEISNDGDGFQEHFRKKHGGTPVEIHTGGMHLLHERRK